LKYNERKHQEGRIITGILEDDAVINRMVSNKYGEIMGSPVQEKYSGSDGDFFNGHIFITDGISFSTPGWKFRRIPNQGAGESIRE
jgi:hypothetical protein